MRKGSVKGFGIEFHPSYLVIALGFVLTGYFLHLIVLTSLILFHEMGHFLVATCLDIKVDKIVIYPFGGMTKLDTIVNLNIAKELLVAGSGVIMQFLFYLLVCWLGNINMIRGYTVDLYTLYSNQMIFFNLLPIYPLDGGKIVHLLFCKFFPYNIANMIVVVSSVLMIFFLFICNIYCFNYSNIMIYFLLFTYVFKFYQRRKYLFYRFLLERYLYHLDFADIKVIKDYYFMYRDKKHILNGMKEESYLKKIFQNI